MEKEEPQEQEEAGVWRDEQENGWSTRSFPANSKIAPCAFTRDTRSRRRGRSATAGAKGGEAGEVAAKAARQRPTLIVSGPGRACLAVSGGTRRYRYRYSPDLSQGAL